MLEANQLTTADTLVSAVFTDPDLLRRLNTTHGATKAVKAGLQVLSEDEGLARAIYEGLVGPALQYQDHWWNYRYEMPLWNVEDRPQKICDSCFELRVRIRYDTILHKENLEFACVTSEESFEELVRAPEYEAQWLCPEIEGVPLGSNHLFEVIDASVDELNLKIHPPNTDSSRCVFASSHPSPPYYDNIGYADLSDFFYVWLRRSLNRVHSDLLVTGSEGSSTNLEITINDLIDVNGDTIPAANIDGRIIVGPATQADLAINKIDDVDPVTAGHTLTYTPRWTTPARIKRKTW